MFGAQVNKPSGGFNFGAPATNSSTPSIFGTSNNQQPAQPSNPFGQNTNPPASVFGQSQPATQGGGLFGQSANTAQMQQTNSLFGNNATQQNTSMFGQSQQKPFSLFGQGNQQQQVQQHVQQQQQAQRPLNETLRFGRSTQGGAEGENGAQPLWEEGRGLGVYRSIPAQMGIIKNKWDPTVVTSPFRTYLYQHVVDETEALRYRPGPDEDENRWEEAVQKRPGSTWVPLQVRGFFELGRKAQLQFEAIQKSNMILQEINHSLDMQLDTHRQKVSTRLAECKRRHQAATQRTLALAVKVQILRNRGYVMDNAEEELKSKLEKLEREVFDPSLNAREQEIWARMLGIRERAKRLKAEMDKLAPTTQNDQPLLDDETVQAAKQTLEAYDKQLRHLQKEMQLIQEEFEDWEKRLEGNKEDRPRRR